MISAAESMLQAPLVSVLIVSYNTRAMTLACIQSVYNETLRHTFEIVVVDNASSDGSAEAIQQTYPHVRVIASETNVGFARGNNVAAQAARGEYLLLLNPDTVILAGAIDKLLDFAMNHPEGSVFGGRTVFAGGTLNPSSVWRKPTLWNAFSRALGVSGVFPGSACLSADAYGGWQRDSDRSVDIVSGCFMLVRAQLWRQLDGLDESYFMYGEDWDFCLRVQQRGLQVWFCADAEIIHHGGASEPVRADKVVRLLQTKAQLYRSHFSGILAKLLVMTLMLWVLRSKATAMTRKRQQDAKTWAEVWSRRDEWLNRK